MNYKINIHRVLLKLLVVSYTTPPKVHNHGRLRYDVPLDIVPYVHCQTHKPWDSAADCSSNSVVDSLIVPLFTALVCHLFSRRFFLRMYRDRVDGYRQECGWKWGICCRAGLRLLRVICGVEVRCARRRDQEPRKPHF